MNGNGAIAIVPVKALAEAKSRLAPVLSPPARRRLVVQMLGDVLAALAVTPSLVRTLVVTSDADIAAIARAKGAEIILEDAPISLNGALRTALHASGCGPYTRCLILPADVPLVTPDEIAVLLGGEPASLHRVMIAPSHDGGGTNALVLTDHDIMGPSFGPDSFKRHLEMAQALHLNPRVVCLPGLGFDIDMPEDLRRLSEVERYRWLDAETVDDQPRDSRPLEKVRR
jgi:2-phospho-L-lactate/phosphoenolpyruvate guanylyltransferase